MENREIKSFPAFVKQIDGRVVHQLFSVSGVIDMHRDRIKRGAFKKTIQERLEKVKVLWQHNFFQPPIGVLLEAKELTKRELPPELKEKFPEATGALEGVVEYLETDRGEEALVGIDKGALTENSIGFDAVKTKYVDHDVNDELSIKVRDIIEIRLWDVSPVNWGANPATQNIKSAVPFESTPIVDNWEGDFSVDWEDMPDTEKRRIMSMFAWTSKLPPESLSDLRMFHHVPTKKGIGPAIMTQVRNGVSQLMHNDVQIDERSEVFGHLAGHYKDNREEPPAFKLVELAHNLRGTIALAGEQQDLYGVLGALTELDAKLKEAEPTWIGEIRQARTHLGLEMHRVRALSHYVDSLG